MDDDGRCVLASRDAVALAPIGAVVLPVSIGADVVCSFRFAIIVFTCFCWP